MNRLRCVIVVLLILPFVLRAQTIGGGGDIVGQSHFRLAYTGVVKKVGYNAANGFVRYSFMGMAMITDTTSGTVTGAEARWAIDGLPNTQMGQTIEIGPGNTITALFQINWVNWTAAGTLVSPNGPSSVTFVVTVPKHGFFKAERANVPLLYKFFDSVTGTLLASKYVAAGETPTFDVTSPDGNGVLWQAYTIDAIIDANGQVVSSPGNTAMVSSGAISGVALAPGMSTGIPGATQNVPDTVSSGTDANGLSVNGVYDGAGGSAELTGGTRFVAKVSDVTNAPTAGADNQTVIKAANIVANAVGVTGAQSLAKLDEIKRAIQSGGGGSSGGTVTVDMTGTNSRLDTTNAKLGEIKDTLAETQEDVNTIAGILNGGHDFNQSSALGDAQAAAAGVEAYSGIKPAGTGVSVSVQTGGAPSFGELTVGGQSLSIGLLNPVGATGDLLALLRPVFLAALCIGFLKGISGTVTSYTAALPAVNTQDTATGPENLVPGVAQAKTYGTAAAAVTTMFAAAAALVAMADTMVTYYGGGIGVIFQALTIPGAGAVGTIDAIFPLGPAMALTILGAGAPYVMAPIYLGAAAVLRFLKT